MMKRVIFEGGISNIDRIDEGLIEPTLNMLFIKEIMSGKAFSFLHCSQMQPGEEYIYLVDGKDCMEFIGIIRDAPNQVVTTKTIKKLGNSVGVAIASEAKVLKLKPEDEVRITIEPVVKDNDDADEILAKRFVSPLETTGEDHE